MSRGLAFCGGARPRFVGQTPPRDSQGPVLSGKWLPAMREAPFTGANAVSQGREAPFTGVNDILFNTII